MHLFLRLGAVIKVVFKRITTQPGMVLAVVLGMVLSISLTMSIPLYTNAVYRELFRTNIFDTQNSSLSRTGFTLMYSYEGGANGPADIENVQTLDTYLTQGVPKLLNLDSVFNSRYMGSDSYQMFSEGETTFSDSTSIGYGMVVSLSGIFDHVKILEGTQPQPFSTQEGAPVDVMISEKRANEQGVQVGEQYTLVSTVKDANGLKHKVEIPVRVVGVWRQSDPNDPFWFINAVNLQDQLLTSDEQFVSMVNRYTDSKIYSIIWFEKLDDSKINYTDANRLVNQIGESTQKAKGILENVRLAYSPIDKLLSYLKNSLLLTVLLYAFSVPIFGMLLAFIGMTSQLSVERYRNEIAVMRSRGVSMLRVVWIGLVEGVVLSAAAMIVGIPCGMGIAWLIGRTNSFLSFSSSTSLGINLTQSAINLGLVVVVATLVSVLAPTIAASRHTLISYKQERSRMMGQPWWQKVWLDVLLLIPAGYGMYLLRNQGGVAVIQDNFGQNVLENPLLFLVPAIGTIALTLLSLRPIPLLMRLVAWASARTRSVGLLMAARHLARSPRMYTVPLGLLILTLSLSTFTASLAQTLDQHLIDQIYYKVGSDIQFQDLGENNSPAVIPGLGGSSQATDSAGSDTKATTEFSFLPIDDYLKIPQVSAATRVGRFTGTATMDGTSKQIQVLGVDRFDFMRVSYWRDDFSTSSLGELMNRMAVNQDGMLVPRYLAGQYPIGGTQHIKVYTQDQELSLDVKVVGYFSLFPTWYPDSGPLVVLNLDYIFSELGSEVPYEVWMKTAANADPNAIAASSNGMLSNASSTWNTALKGFVLEQRRPDRQGLFGLLSIGFIGAALVTVFGFLLYALSSFQKRFVEFGVLRAIGLSTQQMVSMLTWELAFLLLAGGGIGTALGVGVSWLFIPYLQIGVGAAAKIPPYVVNISWMAVFRVYILFGLLFIAGLSILALMLRRIKIFQAVKMGETV